jgi:phosphohistidine swiveling domain-containing protein
VNSTNETLTPCVAILNLWFSLDWAWTTNTMAKHITGIETTENGLEEVGGKGRSLAKLASAGFNVPGGFQVKTSAYRQFIVDNHLQQRILELARPVVVSGRPSFEKAGSNIAKLFEAYSMTTDMVSEITEAYNALAGTPAVAVRSSANAEDLPDLSFAGQQETYLNVTSAAAVVQAVLNCWASLWTAQAISYRHQNGIDQSGVAMAVVVQIMVPSSVSGILFTANPATGERSEMVINASFGLGEAVVSGQVTPDTYIMDRRSLAAKETIIGPKAQQIVADGEQGTRLQDTSEEQREQSSLSDDMLRELVSVALKIEQLNDGLPQDIEWAYATDESGSKLSLLQSRPVTHLAVQPIEVKWEVEPPKVLFRRQIVENMPDPICPLFEELYLTDGLLSARKNANRADAGFVTMNGYAYNRTSKPDEHASKEEAAAARKVFLDRVRISMEDTPETARYDFDLFLADLSDEDRIGLDEVIATYSGVDFAGDLTMPESDNPTYIANTRTQNCDRRWRSWQEEAMPRLVNNAAKWRMVDPASASDETLLEGIVEMAREEGFYWVGNTSATFGIAKSTDDHLQVFLAENLPDKNYISGQFLTGFESKSMQANAQLFEIARLIRANDELTYLLIVTPLKFVMDELRAHEASAEVLAALEDYLEIYGHQGYSLDFIDPTQREDPSAIFATLKTMVSDENYDPANQNIRATAIREQKYNEVSELLTGFTYWQFRYRLWFARRYNHIREETAFYFGYTWSVLRPMAFELGQRLVDVGTFKQPDDIFFMVTEELNAAITARAKGDALVNLGSLASERRELREARKRHHPPGTVPEEASNIPSIKFKETQIKNDDSSDQLNGFAVSSGTVTGRASVILSQADFDKMEPGSILVAPNTTPAWTQLFSHAAGLVTDMGSILAHGSIVAREYGIPAVLGVGNGTIRIKHGQMISVDGDAGTVVLLEEDV